jgi:hypothetical protein
MLSAVSILMAFSGGIWSSIAKPILSTRAGQIALVSLALFVFGYVRGYENASAKVDRAVASNNAEWQKKIASDRVEAERRIYALEQKAAAAAAAVIPVTDAERVHRCATDPNCRENKASAPKKLLPKTSHLGAKRHLVQHNRHTARQRRA